MSASPKSAMEPQGTAPVAELAKVGLLGKLLRIRELSLVAGLVILCAAVTIAQPRFIEIQNLEQILLAVSILAIVAAGQTLVVLTRNIDLSVASTLAFSAYATADLAASNHGLSVVVVILVGCAIGLGLGLLNGLLVVFGRVPAIVATLGTLYVYRGTLSLIVGGNSIEASDMPASYREIATNHLLGVPILIVIALVVAVVLGYFLRRRPAGRHLYAIGGNPDAARQAGIATWRGVLGAFAVCGMLAGLAGVLWASRYATTDSTTATGFELQVVAAVVVGGVNVFGGVGNVTGAVLGALLLGAIANALNLLHFSPFWLQAISGAAILGAVTLDAVITRSLQRILAERDRSR